MWLEKRPNADTLKKQWPFERENGDVLPITRCTQYIPGGKWKVRIAYVEADGYPIASSGPIAANIDAKGKPQNKAKFVPKHYASENEALQEVAKSIAKELNTPNPIWDMINPLVESDEPSPSGYVTFEVKVSDDHKKHLDLHQHLLKYKAGE